jgi:hypothetical protein
MLIIKGTHPEDLSYPEGKEFEKVSTDVIET